MSQLDGLCSLRHHRRFMPSPKVLDLSGRASSTTQYLRTYLHNLRVLWYLAYLLASKSAASPGFISDMPLEIELWVIDGLSQVRLTPSLSLALSPSLYITVCRTWYLSKKSRERCCPWSPHPFPGNFITQGWAKFGSGLPHWDNPRETIAFAYQTPKKGPKRQKRKKRRCIDHGAMADSHKQQPGGKEGETR